MIIRQLSLHNFRSYSDAQFYLAEGLNVVVGPNGIGKTNIVEAICYLSRLKSFRGAPTANLIAKGTQSAVIRAIGERQGREVLIEAEISSGRSKVLVNKQVLKRTKDLLGALQVTVFAPDDLMLIKEGPSGRREYLDDLALALDPNLEPTFSSLDRTLKQRNSLLKQISYKPDEGELATLDVWDKRFAETGEKVVALRRSLVADLVPLINQAYQRLTTTDQVVGLAYQQSWDGELFEAVQKARELDIRRKVTTQGPHRDELLITLNGFESRNEASQGEQRSLALSLKVAAHQLLFQRLGEPPLLLLDDVLSELDDDRAVGLLNNLPKGQTLITSATEIPNLVVPDNVITEFDSLSEADHG